jgi:hypothetical protein
MGRRRGTGRLLVGRVHATCGAPSGTGFAPKTRGASRRRRITRSGRSRPSDRSDVLVGRVSGQHERRVPALLCVRDKDRRRRPGTAGTVADGVKPPPARHVFPGARGLRGPMATPTPRREGHWPSTHQASHRENARSGDRLVRMKSRDDSPGVSGPPRGAQRLASRRRREVRSARGLVARQLESRPEEIGAVRPSQAV